MRLFFVPAVGDTVEDVRTGTQLTVESVCPVTQEVKCVDSEYRVARVPMDACRSVRREEEP